MAKETAATAATKLSWTPWHKVVQLRDDVRSGELSLATFAADLYDVVMGKAKPVYQTPEQFFALTYPTFNLRELAKDVCLRLAGKNDKAVRQLELTYGGGKTHTLITLLHLSSEPESLPELPAVREFIEHIGMNPPKARVAVLPFDKLDPEKGMEVKSPPRRAGGSSSAAPWAPSAPPGTRWLKNPWSVLAWQIAGAEGLKLLHADGKAEERESPPAENLLVELLAMPGKEELSTLLLIDEVLMYARGKVGLEPAWRGKLVDFFQALTQAATKIDRCAIVASLLATDPAKSDSLGKELMHELYAIFRRQREEGVQPVQKEDVAEVLRRRFFTPQSIRDREVFRAHVVAALKGIKALDEQTEKEGNSAEERFLKSYPFHPDLTEVFYTKWTNLESFQRTRGILRTFALALRDSEKWDTAPIISGNVFLAEPGQAAVAGMGNDAISEAARELTGVATSEEYEGKRHEWSAILQGELAKARQMQVAFPGLKHREAEQAVVATFLHSQPIGKKALTRELMCLLGHTRPDKIELEKALKRWTEVSWFLDEAGISEAEAGGLPKTWRLGSRPNLRQMHSEACGNVQPDVIEMKLLDEIQKLKSLTAGASAVVARVHNLPEKVRDIDDDGDFHYAVLGPKGASDSGKPSAEARRYLDEKAGPDSPRVYRNAVVLTVPSRDGLDVARNAIRESLGWEEVKSILGDQELDPIREELLAANRAAARRRVPEAIQQSYCIAVTVSRENQVEAFKLAIDSRPLFQILKEDPRCRIQEGAVNPEALLPGGPYDLWREGEVAHRVKDLVNAFAQRPQLPKMLNRQAILDTLVAACQAGLLVLRLTRPDKSVRTFWRTLPEDVALKDPGLEVVLPDSAALEEISTELLSPSTLPMLWQTDTIAVKDVVDYFGGRVIQVKRDGYEEPLVIPRARREVVESAIENAVKEGRLWLTSGPASVFRESIPAGLLSDDAQLRAPPEAISPLRIVPDTLPEAWTNGRSTALSITVALSKRAGKPLPWAVVADAIDGALRTRILERAEDSGVWPCDYSSAKAVGLRLPQVVAAPVPAPPVPVPRPGVVVARAELTAGQVQDLADQISDITRAAAGMELHVRVELELAGHADRVDSTLARLNEILAAISTDLKFR